MAVYNVTAEEIRNIVTTTASDPNKVYVKVMSTVGSSSAILLDGTEAPSNATGANGNWYIHRVSASGEARLYGPKDSPLLRLNKISAYSEGNLPLVK